MSSTNDTPEPGDQPTPVPRAEQFHSRPDPVEISKAVPIDVAAAAWAFAFAMEALVDATKRRDPAGIEAADAVVTKHRRTIEAAGFVMVGRRRPRLATGVWTWAVALPQWRAEAPIAPEAAAAASVLGHVAVDASAAFGSKSEVTS